MAYDKVIEADSTARLKTPWIEQTAMLMYECDYYMQAFSAQANAEDKTRDILKLQDKYESDFERLKKIKDLSAILSGARKGNAEEEYKLGELYEKENSDQVALSWYLKAAEKNHTRAMLSVYLNSSYLNMLKGYEDTDRKAFGKKYLMNAVNAGSSEAMLHYGMRLTDGYNGFTKNTKEALAWLEKAVEKGNADAIYHIGYIYQTGGPDGKSPDYKKAHDYYKLAIEKGSVRMGNLGLGQLYKNGLGVEKNYDTAMLYYQKRLEADPENADSYFTIGYLCEERKLYDEALDWYEKGVLKDKEGYGGIFASKAGPLYFEAGKYDLALSYLKKSEKDSLPSERRVGFSCAG